MVRAKLRALTFSTHGRFTFGSMRAETYVVRIYRRGRPSRRTVVGVLEAARSGWQKPFQSLQELADILAAPSRPARRPHEPSNPDRTSPRQGEEP
jgi:hypothetical protein